MWEVIKGWFVEPTTDAALGTLSKTVKKLDRVNVVQTTRSQQAKAVAERKAAEAEARAQEATRASVAYNRISKLVNGE